MSKTIYKAISGFFLGLAVIMTVKINATVIAPDILTLTPENSANINSTELPVLAIDLHDTVLERDNSIAIKEILRAPAHGFKFIKRAIKYRKHKKQGRTKISIEEYATKNSPDPKFDLMVTKTISCFKPMPGAIGLLSKLKQAGYKIFVFSNISPKSYELLCQDYPELFNLFDGKVIVKQNNLTKDTPEAYKFCIETISQNLGYIPKKIILFDDLQANCNLAKQTDPIFDAVRCQNNSRKNWLKSRENLLSLLENYSPEKKPL
jgi:FMN phosphatase YigB (HAD superfamily)